jgi:hypothetical protein
VIVWLWALLPIGMFIGTRVINTRLIVPRWRAGLLGSGSAALLVAALRGLITAALLAAVVLIAGLPLASGLLTAATAGAIYFAVSRHSIRRMFERAEEGASDEVDADG